MQSRIKLLTTLTVIERPPGGFDDECPICTDDFESPVALPCKHIYCRKCICEWLSMRSRNTCPKCRVILFTNNDANRGPVGYERLQLVALAFQHSGLMGDRYEEYTDELSFNVSTIQRASAAAHQYLAEETHSAPTEDVLIHMGLLGPHLIAMANLLEGYAQAAGRPYSGYQSRDWKLIVSRLIDLLLLADGQTRSGRDVVRMAAEYRGRIRESLTQDLIDIHSGRFFEPDARLDSPCGDLDVLLNYMVFRCPNLCEERRAQQEELARQQQEALEQESTAVGYGMRWLGQAVFGGV